MISYLTSAAANICSAWRGTKSNFSPVHVSQYSQLSPQQAMNELERLQQSGLWGGTHLTYNKLTGHITRNWAWFKGDNKDNDKIKSHLIELVNQSNLDDQSKGLRKQAIASLCKGGTPVTTGHLKNIFCPKTVTL